MATQSGPSTQALHSPHSEKTQQLGDIESGGLLDGGASLGRSISVQLTAEQFERLYLQPGGQKAKGDLSKRFANPTPLGLASFLLCLTPFSCYLMGWAGTTTAAAPTLVGAMLFMGGLGLMVAAILEFILGNTFTVVVFFTFGSFWLSFGFLLQPEQGIAAALGATSVDYNGGISMYLFWWSVLTLIYLVASMRTNVVFFLLFLFLDVAFWLLAVLYLKLAHGDANVGSVLKSAGAFAFLCTMTGNVGIPIKLPVGDLSGFMSRRPHHD
ncbi:hypothetical protein JCM1841_007090 [Sporobolomyces salmonicolor]